MNIEISRNVGYGSLVTFKGKKLILASRRTKKIIGVFNNQSHIEGFTLGGDTFSFHIPAGILTHSGVEAMFGGKK